MKDVLQAYKNVEYALPDKVLTWYLYGAGMENFGKEHKPEEVPFPKYGPDELLVRIDAVGICFSDIKVINQGNQHARITGRDMVKDPVTLGHEPSITVVGVGENIKDKYKVGERFIVQADIYYKGKSMAFGYVLPGAQTQFQVLTKELLNGDEGAYLIPLQEKTGYAESALTEAWSCVVASYRIGRRSGIKPGGILWIIGTAGGKDHALGMEITSSTVVATGVSGSILEELKSQAASGKFKLVETEAFQSLDLEKLAAEYEGAFDDIIVLGSDVDVIEKSAKYMGKFAVMNIVSSEKLPSTVKIDVGKVHYMDHSYVGTTEKEISKAYKPIREMSEIKSGGAAWFIGGAGPMGKMHVQLALEMENCPSKVLVTDVGAERLASAVERFEPIAKRKNIEFKAVNPAEMSGDEFSRLVSEFTDGKGFDDIVVLAPVAALIGGAVPFLGKNGLMNIFAGVPIGTIADLDLTGVYEKQIRFVGSSGSKLSDMRDTLNAAESGGLSTGTALAGIGGIDASWDGMLAVKELKFTGKVVIYPQIHLPLMSLEGLKEQLPNVYAKLTDGKFWNGEAEAELLKSTLKLDSEG
jgi:D-arabinose 1-dehydrogenase-like Zn-dependent alcohol dehydrogenase